MRVKFCGCIVGSVVVRSGETPQEAIDRAQETILKLFERSARNLSLDGDGLGPNVGLEIDDNI